MEIMKIVGVALIALIIVVILKQYRPEFAIYTSIVAGVVILFLVMDELQGIISLLQNFANKSNINSKYLGLLL